MPLCSPDRHNAAALHPNDVAAQHLNAVAAQHLNAVAAAPHLNAVAAETDMSVMLHAAGVHGKVHSGTFNNPRYSMLSDLANFFSLLIYLPLIVYLLNICVSGHILSKMYSSTFWANNNPLLVNVSCFPGMSSAIYISN